MKKYIKEFREEFDKASVEDRAYIMIMLAILGVIAGGITALFVALFIELLPYLLGAGVFYLIGAWKWGFPVPGFLKRFF